MPSALCAYAPYRRSNRSRAEAFGAAERPQACATVSCRRRRPPARQPVAAAALICRSQAHRPTASPNRLPVRRRMPGRARPARARAAPSACPAEAAAAFGRSRAPRTALTASSESHGLQCAHWPCHLSASPPQARQTYRVWVRATGVNATPGGRKRVSCRVGDGRGGKPRPYNCDQDRALAVPRC